MSNILKNIVGDVPEVPVKIVVDDQSIVRLAVAAVIVVALCLLITKLINKGGK